MTTFGVQLLLSGRTIASKWDGTRMVALNDLSIVWGREDAYDAAEPGTLSASVIDPTGDWITGETLGGQKIAVVRTSAILGDLIVFRGRISKASATRRRVFNPVTKTRDPVWVVNISAGDRLAEAASTILTGEMGEKSVEGPGGWGEQNPVTRMTNLFDRGAGRVFSAYDTVPSEANSQGTILRRMHGQSASDQRTLLELIEQVYRLVPLGVVNYDPDANAVRIGSYAKASSINLVYTGGVVRFDLPSGRAVSADRVAVPDGLAVESTSAEAIDIVQVSYTWYGADPNLSAGQQKRVIYTGGIRQEKTARGATSDSNRILKYDTEAMFLDPDEYAADSVVPYINRTPGWLAEQIVGIVDTINGQLRLPTVRLDDRRFPLDAATSDVLYRPFQLKTALYFTGSVFNTLPNAGPQYQPIGGTLRYDRGWTHDLVMTPAQPRTITDPDIAAVFGTTSAAQLGQFDPDIRLGDLANVTTGL
ncbi:hypothetical protein [Curtobacterium sp. VKM Ac-1376]|uniref:hypothetical protein n=1 Tax=Curtobacterium sp. VKM Ac-1376 TaxID=123312 RepID=UPI00188BBB22|nr:hypothetical protein [Curtobacterium sp. VKM Ac-1376]MBF4613276.1 hypothetical protein [Curtobacterium sp. VKM Ac-1376]